MRNNNNNSQYNNNRIIQSKLRDAGHYTHRQNADLRLEIYIMLGISTSRGDIPVQPSSQQCNTAAI